MSSITKLRNHEAASQWLLFSLYRSVDSKPVRDTARRAERHLSGVKPTRQQVVIFGD
jgi:hypothetical protein